MKLDLAFPAFAVEPLPQDSGYILFAAISRLVPKLHEAKEVGIHPLRGRQIASRLLALTNTSNLTLRIDDREITLAFPLSGQMLSVGGKSIQLGVPRLFPLIAAPALRSRLVTIKGMIAPDLFADAVRRQLADSDVEADVTVVLGKRRTLRIRHKEIVGFEVLLEGLSAAESIAVQERGIGGRRHMGCGVFSPFRA